MRVDGQPTTDANRSRASDRGSRGRGPKAS